MTTEAFPFGNLLVLGFCGLVAWALWALALPAAKTGREVRAFHLPLTAFLAFLLLVNALWADSLTRSWRRLARLPATASVEALGAMANQAPVALVGTVSPRNRRAEGDHVLHDEGEGLAGERWDLLVEVEGGTVQVTRVEAARRWRWSSESNLSSAGQRSWLSVGQPVVVQGVVRHSRPISGPAPARPLVEVEARVVLHGTYLGFVALAGLAGTSLLPRALSWLSLVGSALVGALPLVHLGLRWERAVAVPPRRKRRKRDEEPLPPRTRDGAWRLALLLSAAVALVFLVVAGLLAVALARS